MIVALVPSNELERQLVAEFEPFSAASSLFALESTPSRDLYFGFVRKKKRRG